jgi:hypothetical protein
MSAVDLSIHMKLSSLQSTMAEKDLSAKSSLIPAASSESLTWERASQQVIPLTPTP